MFAALKRAAAPADGGRISAVRSAAVVVLALCLGLAAWQGAKPPAEDVSDPVALMQTFHHISSARDRTASLKAAAVAELAQPQASTKAALEQLEECEISYIPLDQQLRERALELIGYIPQRTPCRMPGTAPVSLISGATDAVSAAHASLMTMVFSLDPYMCIPIGYGLFAGVALCKMTHNILVRDPANAKKAVQQSGYRPKRRLETESWNRGLIGWMAIDWASEWVARWGDSSEDTNIKADELEALGDPEDEPQHNFPILLKLWHEEVEKKGIKNASLVMVMIRFVTWPRLLRLVIWTTLYEVAMYLGPPLAMEWTVRYMSTLYTSRLMGYTVDSSALMWPSILGICIYTGIPVFMAISNTVSAFLSQRLGIQACGALACLVVHTAQCLPEKNHATKEDSDSEEEELDEDEKLLRMGVDKNGQWSGPKEFNLVQVVSNDINMSFIELPLQAARALIILPICVILIALVYVKIRNTIFLVIGTALGFTFLTMMMAQKQIGYMLAFNHCAGHRLQFLEGIMFNIRTVKSCGWIEVVRKKVIELRQHELKALELFYWRLGYMYNFSFMLPRAMIMVAVWGRCWLYPSADHLNIFATLPLLFTMQNAINTLMQTLPAIINARPAIVRCQTFLQQHHAPCGRPRSEHVPDWMTLWPEQSEGSPLASVSEEEEDSKGDSMPAEPPAPKMVRMQGSFKRREEAKCILKDIDITIQLGECVAVLGQVGSGKTTLLHGILGELFPEGDSRVEVPMVMGYSAQVPYITEETLRENVLYGSALDEERYNMAIHAACLLPDLEVLPGGDNVPIGSRGISLSGGQKARVSMARMAYASQEGSLCLMDDPFGAVDGMTAKHILQNLVHGKILEGRTKIIACQPDAERIVAFDKVIVLKRGRIVEQGTPQEVMKTQAYISLLNSHQAAAVDKDVEKDEQQNSGTVVHGNSVMGLRPGSDPFVLREEECQGRMDWSTIDYFCSTGKWYLLNICIVFFLLTQIAQLLCNIVLQHWSSNQILEAAAIQTGTVQTPMAYLRGYLFWWAVSTALWFICWAAGVWFTLRMSSITHELTMDRLLNAPIDKFFDKTPVGRIMNRLSSDLVNLDTRTFNQITTMIGLVWQTIVPIGYIHLLMPVYFSCLSVPWYYLMFQVVRRYWNTMVPMRYLCHASKSHMDNLLTEVDASNLTVRAMQKAPFMLARFMEKQEDTIKSEITCTLVLSRWLVNRLFILMGFFITVIVLLGMWIPGMISFGGLGLCLTNCFVLVTCIEGYMGTASQAQFQFISMNRLYEYTQLPEEKAQRIEGDQKYRSFALNIERKACGTERLKRVDTPQGIRIVKVQQDARMSLKEEVILEQVPGQPAFRGADGGSLAGLCKSNEQLQDTTKEHRIIAISGVRGDADAMVTELLREVLPDAAIWEQWLKLDVQSEWLADGTEIVIENLRVGYGDIPRDILKDININIEKKSKVGIVGSTGCGKSTLMLSLLRILEPRGGTIKMNGVDTSSLGLATLRTSIGMVPQDPVLLAGSLRDSVDPFQFYTDREVWAGLRLVQLEDVIKKFDWGLYQPLAAEGGNLSFGQRQLLCLARCVIRQPSLILLDEATSALDPYTQELVQQTIQSAFPRSTIVVIAHRLETIMDFDKVIVMDQGVVLEQGSVQELKNLKGGRFQQMLASKKTW